jgi:hypothetical protein
MTESGESRAKSVLVAGVIVGVVTGLVVGIVGRWLDFHPALTSGVIAAVTSATVTTLHLQSKKAPK